VADMAEHGGLVTARDLAEYAPLVRPSIRRTVGEWDLAVNPPPSVGGPMLAVMLGELGRRGRVDWDDVIAIQHAVLRYRLEVHDLESDLDAAGHELLLSVDRHGLAGLPTSASTAHISAVDSDGNACAVTMSAGYGAGLTVPGTGMLLNNALGEPELNKLGLHRLVPGTRLASNMAPTTGRTPDGRVLAIGSPGADRITTALMQVLGQGCLHDADLQHAIDAPRLHVRFGADGSALVEHETDAGIAAAVAASGLPSHDHGELSMYFGGVGAAYRREDGALQAAGDPRREAAVAVVGA
jgi:gamma-glutamyltranspeptidase/glutathione hydrolase